MEKGTTTSSTFYVHPDHLGSTHTVTNATGSVVQAMDYYPYGSTRIDSTPAKTDLKKQYIGQYFDDESSLSYLNARYLNSERGQFISQDPVFLEIGQTEDGIRALFSPQTQNSYSYAANNPIVNKDPDGRYLETAFDVAMLAWSLDDFRADPGFWNGATVVADGLSLAFPVPAVVGGLRHGNEIYQGIRIAQDVKQATNWGGSAFSLVDHTRRHATDFGLKRNDYTGYARAADSFVSRADSAIKQGSSRYETFKGAGRHEGKTYFFDSKTSTFGVRNADGKTLSAYKPYKGDSKKASAYWERQKKSKGGQ